MSRNELGLMNLSRKEIIPFIVLCTLNTVWILAAWPASLSPDSLGVIDYIRQGRYFDWHTVTWLLYVKITTINGNLIWLSILLQVFLMNFLIFKLIKLFRPKIHFGRNLWLCVILVATPWIGANQVTLWKDVTYSIFVLLGLLVLITGIEKNRFSILGLALLSFGSACRHEGWATLFMTFVGIGIYTLFKREKVDTKKTVITLSSIGLAAILSVAGNSFLVNITNAERIPQWLNTQSFLGDIAYVVAVAPETLDPTTVDFINSQTTSSIGLTREICENSAPYYQAGGFNQSIANVQAPSVLKEWIKVLKKNPTELAKARFCKSKTFLPWPLTGYTTYSYYWVEWGMWVPNWLNMVPEPPLPILRSIMTFWLEMWNINGRFLSAVGWQISLLTCLLILLKKKEVLNFFAFSILFFVAWSRDLLFILVGHGGDGRLSILISILMLTTGIAGLTRFIESKH